MPVFIRTKVKRCFFIFLFLTTITGRANPTDTSAVSPFIRQRIDALVERIKNELVNITPSPFSVPRGDYSPSAFESIRQQLYKGNAEQAYQWLQTCVNDQRIIRNPEKWLTAKSLSVEYLFSTESYTKAYNLALELVNFADSLKVQHKEDAYLPFARAATFVQDYGDANAYIETVLESARLHGNVAAEAKAQLAAGSVARAYFYGSTHRSIPYYNKAIEAAKKCGDTITLIRTLLLKHSDIAQSGDVDNGFPYLEEAVNLVLRSGYIRFAPNIYEHICTELEALRRTSEMPHMYLQSVAFARRLSMPLFETHMYGQLSSSYLTQKMYDSALYYISLAKNDGLLAPGSETPGLMKARIFAKMGKYKEADSLYDAEMGGYLNRFVLQGQSSISRWETRLRMRDKEVELGQNAARRKQLLGALAGIGLLLAVTLWGYFRQRSLRKNLTTQNTIIQNQRQILQDSLRGRELLLKEIHHRVRNNLQVISSILELQTASVTENGAVKSAITEGQNRLKSIALIHQRLYQNEQLSAVEFGSFVRELFQQISSVLKKPGHQIQTVFSVPETYIDLDTAVPLSLICNEVITNAFKYAFEQTAFPSFSVELLNLGQKRYELRLSDNGPGLPNRFEFDNANTLGLKLIRRLSRQIGGEARYEYNSGATFVVWFSNLPKGTL